VRAAKVLAWAALAAIGLATPGVADGYPDRSVRMIVAFPAGGTLDVLARIVSQKLTEQWGQSVVVENRPGAGGNIGVTAVATAAPDGYTLHFGAQSLAVNATLAPIKGFDPTRDLVPVVLVGTAQDVLMVPPVRALAVSGAVRAEELPDVPTFNELGVPFVDETSWYAIFAPRGTPEEIVAKINADVNRILLLPDVREKQRMFGYRFIGGPPQRLADLLRSEIKRWADVAKSAALAQ